MTDLSANESPHEPDYIARTIETVRNHRDADNCWPQWANIFADEIERLWRREAELVALANRYKADLDRAAVENESLRAALEGHEPSVWAERMAARMGDTDLAARLVAAEADATRYREALETIEQRTFEYALSDRHRDGLAHVARTARAALASAAEGGGE